MADVDPGQEMMGAARYGELDELRALFAAESPPDANFLGTHGATALHYACGNGHTNCALLLIQKGARHVANGSGNTPLHWAALNGHLDVVKALMVAFDDDIDVLAKNDSGRSALTEAFTGGNQDISSLLLAHSSASALEEAAAKTGDEDGAEEETDELAKPTPPPASTE